MLSTLWREPGRLDYICIYIYTSCMTGRGASICVYIYRGKLTYMYFTCRAGSGELMCMYYACLGRFGEAMHGKIISKYFVYKYLYIIYIYIYVSGSLCEAHLYVRYTFGRLKRGPGSSCVGILLVWEVLGSSRVGGAGRGSELV